MKKFAYFTVLLTCLSLMLGGTLAHAAKAPTVSNKTIKEAQTDNKTVKVIKNKTQDKKTQVVKNKEVQIPIMGKAVAKPSQVVGYIRSVNPKVKLDCSVEELVALYYREAEAEGIRPDMALVQAIHETGTFKFGGDAKYHQNNFCGLGVVGSGARGVHFKTPQDGVRAHVQHLMAYVTERKPKTKLVDPRYSGALSVRRSRGFITNWNQLAGTWAMDKKYFVKLYAIYQRVLAVKANDRTDKELQKLDKKQLKELQKQAKEQEKVQLKEKKEAEKKAKAEQEGKKYTSPKAKKPVISNEPLKR